MERKHLYSVVTTVPYMPESTLLGWQVSRLIASLDGKLEWTWWPWLWKIVVATSVRTIGSYIALLCSFFFWNFTEVHVVMAVTYYCLYRPSSSIFCSRTLRMQSLQLLKTPHFKDNHHLAWLQAHNRLHLHPHHQFQHTKHKDYQRHLLSS